MSGTRHNEIHPIPERISVKVTDPKGHLIFKIRPDTKFLKLFEIYANRRGWELDQLLGEAKFLFGDVRITPDKTPHDFVMSNNAEIHAILPQSFLQTSPNKSIRRTNLNDDSALCMIEVARRFPPSSSTKPTNEKQGPPNWTIAEQEQLLTSWLSISQQALVSVNQTGETIYKKLEVHFNQYSKTHYRDAEQIKTYWAALITATSQFDALYNYAKQNGPSTPTHWLRSAHDLYRQQNKVTFQSLTAWQKLRYVLDWRTGMRKDMPKPLNHQSDVNQTGDSMTAGAQHTTTISGAQQPRASFDAQEPNGSAGAQQPITISFPDRPKCAKRKRPVSGAIAQELIDAILEENSSAKIKNDISAEHLELEKRKVKIEEDKLELEKKYREIQNDHHLSEVRMNELKLLQSADGHLDADGKQALNVMKKEVKKKWVSQFKDIISSEKEKIEVEEELAKKHQTIQNDHHLSKILKNELNFLTSSDKDLDEESKQVLQIMKKDIKQKWLSRATV